MRRADIDFYIKEDEKTKLKRTDEIIDVTFVRTNHYCKDHDEYWENRKDESIYLKVRDKENAVDKTICLAKNIINEYEVYFDTFAEKEEFFKVTRNNKFYNFLDVYVSLNDTQVIQFLNIMTKNRDNYDYNFQYCDQNRVIFNSIRQNLISGSSAVRNAYQAYLLADKKQLIEDDSSNNKELETMLKEGTNNNVIPFDIKARK